MTAPATIKLFLTSGASKGVRTAEIINWSGIAVAGPRKELPELLSRAELERGGVYLLVGGGQDSGKPKAYIGEADTLRDRLKQQMKKDWWTQAMVFASKDDNLSKAHIKFLEGRMIELAKESQRADLVNTVQSTAKLSESDIADMELFLGRIRQLLPILGSDILVPQTGTSLDRGGNDVLTFNTKGLTAKGRPTDSGFVVFKGSGACGPMLPSASQWITNLRESLINEGVLVSKGEHLIFSRDHEFSSSSAAGSMIRGGNVAGPLAWKSPDGKTLKDLEDG